MITSVFSQFIIDRNDANDMEQDIEYTNINFMISYAGSRRPEIAIDRQPTRDVNLRGLLSLLKGGMLKIQEECFASQTNSQLQRVASMIAIYTKARLSIIRSFVNRAKIRNI